MAYRIDLGPCINCGLCRRACPTETIRFFTTGRRTHVIEPAGCIDCDLCAQVCPVNCICPDPAYTHDPAERQAAKQKAKTWARRRYEREENQRRAALAALTKLGGSTG